MSHYIMIRRLRGPAFLLLVGVLALLNQADVISWGHSWPFFLILAGVMALAERAALATEGGAYPAAPYPGAPYAGAPVPTAAPAPETNAIVPAHGQEYEKEPDGGQQ
jgi:hypothetical protein